MPLPFELRAVEMALKDSKGRNIAEKIDEITNDITPKTVSIDYPADYDYTGSGMALKESGAEKLASLRVGDTVNVSGPGSLLGSVIKVSSEYISSASITVPKLIFAEFSGSVITLTTIVCYANRVSSTFIYKAGATMLYKHTYSSPVASVSSLEIITVGNASIKTESAFLGLTNNINVVSVKFSSTRPANYYYTPTNKRLVGYVIEDTTPTINEVHIDFVDFGLLFETINSI